jgi:putative hydrolase of the HAD superfamily
MEPSAVVFDLDYTLAVTDRDRQTLLDEATEAAGVRRIDRQEYLDAHGADLASETRAPIFEAILEDGDPAAVAASYRDAINSDLEAVPGAETLLRDLGARYRLGLLTDGPTRAQYSKLDALGWRDLFDAVVVTGSLPAGKPDERTFATVLEALDARPESTVFVGDNPEADIEGAAAAGLYAIQVLREGETASSAADATVDASRFADDVRDLLLAQSRLG